MASRPRPPAGGTLDYNRLAARIEKAVAGSTERFEELLDGVDVRIKRVERDIAADALEKVSLVREMAEMRRDFGELRDLVNGRASVPAETIAQGVAAEVRHVAKGVAAEAVEAAQVVAAAAAETADRRPKGAFWSSWKGWAVGVAAVAAGLKAVVDIAPWTINAIESAIRFMKGTS